jgi:hypothetical protein
MMQLDILHLEQHTVPQLPFSRRLILLSESVTPFVYKGEHSKVLERSPLLPPVVIQHIDSTLLINPPTYAMATGIALVGSGIFIKEEHLPAVQATQLLSLKAIYSRSLKSAKAVSEHLSDIDLYSEDSEGKTYDDLLKRDDIKGVIIACVSFPSTSCNIEY